MIWNVYVPILETRVTTIKTVLYLLTYSIREIIFIKKNTFKWSD